LHSAIAPTLIDGNPSLLRRLGYLTDTFTLLSICEVRQFLLALETTPSTTVVPPE
jgi:hypothetical protein